MEYHIQIETNKFHNDDIWGVYDGESYYINENNKFFPLIFEENRILIFAPSTSQGNFDKTSSVVSLGVMTTILFSLRPSMPFGQALLIAMATGVVVDLGISYFINSNKGYVYYEIDLLTGLVNQVGNK